MTTGLRCGNNPIKGESQTPLASLSETSLFATFLGGFNYGLGASLIVSNDLFCEK